MVKVRMWARGWFFDVLLQPTRGATACAEPKRRYFVLGPTATEPPVRKRTRFCTTRYCTSSAVTLHQASNSSSAP